MKKMKLALSLFLAAGLLAAPGYAQQDSGDSSVADSDRPAMPALFFTPEQRRILEAVRQGAVETDVFQVEEFVPVVFADDVFDITQDVVEEVEVRQRNININVDSLIRNRSKDNVLLWVNNQVVDLKKDKAQLEQLGINFESASADSGGVIKGQDSFTNSVFELQLGQSIATDGAIEERLPVIIRHKKTR